MAGAFRVQKTLRSIYAVCQKHLFLTFIHRIKGGNGRMLVVYRNLIMNLIISSYFLWLNGGIDGMAEAFHVLSYCMVTRIQ